MTYVSDVYSGTLDPRDGVWAGRNEFAGGMKGNERVVIGYKKNNIKPNLRMMSIVRMN